MAEAETGSTIDRHKTVPRYQRSHVSQNQVKKLKTSVHKAARNKSPGSDGITHDFYIVLRAPSTWSSSRSTTRCYKGST